MWSWSCFTWKPNQPGYEVFSPSVTCPSIIAIDILPPQASKNIPCTPVSRCGEYKILLYLFSAEPFKFGSPTKGSEFKRDRKSTRLNSSHDQISYAVFCLKKKKTIESKVERNDECSPRAALDTVR